MVASFSHTSRQESCNHHDLRDRLNNQLHNRDLRERLNDRRFHRDANQGRGNIHDSSNLDPVNQQIHELQRQIEEIRCRSAGKKAVTNLLEESESPLKEEIRMAVMLDRLKLLDAEYDGTDDPADHLETYRSWMELNSTTNAFKCSVTTRPLAGRTYYYYYP